MKLTRLKALELCEELWRWLAKNPKCGIKDMWPGWDNLDAMNDCFACEYNLQKHPEWSTLAGEYCADTCILKPIWPNGCCDDENSPYLKWDNGKNKKKNATIIADFCKNEIARLKKKKK